jgi:hypothetical protein
MQVANVVVYLCEVLESSFVEYCQSYNKKPEYLVMSSETYRELEFETRSNIVKFMGAQILISEKIDQNKIFYI